MLNLSTKTLDRLLAAGQQARAAGRFPAAESCLRQALAANPNHLEALLSLALLLQDRARFDEAEALYQKILAIAPQNLMALNNLAVIYQGAGFSAQAIETYQRFLRIDPNNAVVHTNLATVLHETGLIEEALAANRRALELNPDLLPAASALLLMLNYHPDYDERAIAVECRRWNDTVVKRHVSQPIASHPNSRDPNRPLRIGYVSPDFHNHPIGRFMIPILEHHDRANFHVTCYALRPIADQVTARLKTAADGWRDVHNLPNDQLVALIQQDQVDILVDLAMHTFGGRPLLFARKPAPLQMNYLAYPGVTGLAAIDYRITDIYLDPANSNDQSVGAESPLRLRSYWCYEPMPGTPPVSELPALRNNFITFAALNNFAKVTPAALETWAKLLATPIPSLQPSRLILFCSEGAARERVRKVFAAHRIPSENLEFTTRGSAQYFNAYIRSDIALDTFPFAGGTTSCDALYMGLPVVTLAGNKQAARAGVSVLSNVGLENLITHSIDDYQHRAVSLASDLPALAAIRQTLRQKLLASPLANAPACTRDLESLYRRAWQTYCTTR